MLSGYIQDMTALVMPKNWDSMMLVARNDIWVNMKQIKGNVSDTEQVIWGGALQHYKDVHTHISKPHISSSMTESEKRSARAEYDRKVRERAQREENYKKLKAFTETQAKQAKQELEECYKEIEDLYRNRIVVYENTDDEYKKTAVELYRQCTDFGEKLSNFGVKSAKTVWNVGRGALAAVLDLVKTALAIQGLKNTLDTLPFAVVTEVMGIEVPGLSLEKVDDLKNMAYGAVAALQDPPRVLAALGQKIGDTVEEEGIAYSISYVAADVAIQVLLSKGLGEVKNVSKADDLVDVARTVDTLDDTVKIADELTDAAKVLDQVGDIKDAAMAVNVMDETNAAVKAVDEVNDVADAVKTVEKLDGVIESGEDVLDEIKRIDEIEVEFNYNSKFDEAEFARQLADQQKGMNELTVREYLDNRQKYIGQGRAIESNAAQQAAREKAFVDKVDELQDAGLSLKEAEEQAEKWLDTQAALHNPDQVAGGYASNVGGVGDKGVNSSIGSQWRYRIDGVDAQIKKMAESMSEAEKNSTYLNVKLAHKGD